MILIILLPLPLPLPLPLLLPLPLPLRTTAVRNLECPVVSRVTRFFRRPSAFPF